MYGIFGFKDYAGRPVRPDRGDAAGYKEKAAFDVPGEKFWSAAVVANGKIYTRSRTEAFCYDVSK